MQRKTKILNHFNRCIGKISGDRFIAHNRDKDPSCSGRLRKEHKRLTFVTVSGAFLKLIKDWLSYARIKRRPSPVAKIFILFSFAETANNEPSLLKRIRGHA